MNRNGNSANFFLYVCNDEKIEELFASTLNGITASVKCVSSIIVVFTLNLTDCLRHTQTKKIDESRRSPTRVPCFAS